MVGEEMASTASARHWDNTAPDGSCATDGVPSPHPRCLPGRSRALPTLQEWGSTVVATTHLACTLSPSKCLTPSDCAHMARACLFVIWPVQHAQLTKHHRSHQSNSLSFWAHTCKLFFCFLFDASWGKCHLRCQIEWHSAQSTQAQCLACAFLSPWGGEEMTSPKPKKKGCLCTAGSVWPSLSWCYDACMKEIARLSPLSLHLLRRLSLPLWSAKKKKITYESYNCYAASMSAMVEPDAISLRSSSCWSWWTEDCIEGFW